MLSGFELYPRWVPLKKYGASLLNFSFTRSAVLVPEAAILLVRRTRIAPAKQAD